MGSAGRIARPSLTVGVRCLVFQSSDTDPERVKLTFIFQGLHSHVVPGKIGLEPLDASFTPEAFEALARRSKQPVKLFLLDQRHVAGIGNIYAAEALFRAKIDPRKLAGAISKVRRAALYHAIIEVLKGAVGESYNAPGDEFPSAVYGREGEPCRRCRTLIRRIPQGGRSTYFCPRCQR